MTRKIAGAVVLVGLLAFGFPSFAGDDLIGVDGNTGQYTGFTNQGSIVNTRHNLTQSTLAAGILTSLGGAMMDGNRNNYGEVCVYCHTPHGANTNTSAPLWNRSISVTASTYTTYDQLGSSTAEQTYSQPGAASLPCLSCHDGRQAVDAIINMPGTGRYNPTPNDASGSSGDLWTRWNVAGKRSLDHASLRSGTTGRECLSCHSPSGASAAVDFTVFAIGTDLRNDHPVGVTYPAPISPVPFWNVPTGVKTTVTGFQTRYFEEGTANGHMDKNEIRLYDTGEGAEVECASCHDPHGVKGSGTTFNATFLRKSNSGSAVCLTCHAK